MSKETRLFSSRNGAAAAHGKEEERAAGWGGWGGSGDCIKQPLETPPGKQAQLCGATFVLCPADPFFTTGRKTHSANPNIFHYAPALHYSIPEWLPQSPSSRAERGPRFIVRGTSWKGAIVGRGEDSHSIPVKGNLSGLSSIPAVSRGTPAG